MMQGQGALSPQAFEAEPMPGQEPLDQPIAWLPAEGMRRYIVAKIIGAVGVSVIFIGWLIIQWSNPVMRIVTLLLLAMTMWFTLASILEDLRRIRGRQLWLEKDAFVLETPQGSTRIEFSQIAYAQWREDDSAHWGMWFYDRNGQVLVHLDADVIKDQAEAWTFLGWTRKHVTLPFAVRWPEDNSQ